MILYYLFWIMIYINVYYLISIESVIFIVYDLCEFTVCL